VKRWLPYLLLLALPLLLGFTLIDYGVDATPRLRWETSYQGAAYTTQVPLGTAFHAPFVAFGYSGVGGFAYWRGDAITCTAGIGGAQDGGAGGNEIVMEVYHEDGGVDCSATLGFGCNYTGANGWVCAGGAFQMNYASTYYMRMSTSTTCSTMPAQYRCTMDLYR